jgi:hypothetical protein
MSRKWRDSTGVHARNKKSSRMKTAREGVNSADCWIIFSYLLYPAFGHERGATPANLDTYTRLDTFHSGERIDI